MVAEEVIASEKKVADTLPCISEGCVRCCADKGNPLELTAGDILRLCRKLSIGAGDFYAQYCEIIWNRIPGTYLFIPSIGLVFPCRFLESGRCAVYDVRPIHCRLFPEGLAADNNNMDIYRNCGYRCVDKGIKPAMANKPYIHRLRDLDGYELRSTASYFENFRYCVELKAEEIESINSLAFEDNIMERAAQKRDLFTAAINKKNKEKVEVVFIKKLCKLSAKFPKADDGYLSVISKSF